MLYPDVNWGSSTQGQSYVSALKSTLSLQSVKENIKNYRPQILVLSGQPLSRPCLLDVGTLFTKNVGLLVCGHVVPVRASSCGNAKAHSISEVYLPRFIFRVLSAAVYLPRFICRGLSAAFYLPRFICCGIFAAFLLPRFICCGIFAAFYLPRFIFRGLSAAVYLQRFICRVLSAAVYLPRFICRVLSAAVYLPRFICRVLSAAVYLPSFSCIGLSAAVYLPRFICCSLFAAFYLHSYRVLNDSMLNVRDDLFMSILSSVFFLQNASSRTISIESFKTR